ncbi:MAG TPA: DUF4258 domain-containing protein [Candidatus Paceibacterota bacterium]
MKIVFSTHALTKLKQRNIDKRLVLDTIRAPQFKRPAHQFREERIKYFGRNWLRVVVVKEGDTFVVVTAHWIDRLR